MAYWIAEKNDGSPFEKSDIIVYPSLADATQYSGDLQNLCLSYVSAPECVSDPSEQDMTSS